MRMRAMQRGRTWCTCWRAKRRLGATMPNSALAQQKAGKSHWRAVCHACTHKCMRKKLPRPRVDAASDARESIKKDRQSQKQSRQWVSEWEREGRDWSRCYLPLNLAITLAARCTNGRAAKINYPLRGSEVAFNFCAYFYNKRRAPAWYNYCPSGRCYWWLVRKIKPLNNNNKTESVYGHRAAVRSSPSVCIRRHRAENEKPITIHQQFSTLSFFLQQQQSKH